MTTTHKSELTGRRLGAFRVDELLGRGGMGAVYRGFDTALERPVAVKVLGHGLSSDPGYVERFVREARTAARLNHPNVVQVYGAGFQDDVAYMALELVTGGSLADVFARVRPFPLRRACEVVRDVARALAAAHTLGIVHRDLKPDNVLLTPDGVVKLADFGLARSLAGSRITQSGTFMGTPQYSSPEQCNGVEVGFASDLYSLGVVLYELLAGKPPHHAPTPLALFKKILVEDVPPVTDLRGEVPPSLVAILGRLLQKDPAARYPDAGELADDLDKVIARLPQDDAGASSVLSVLNRSSPDAVTVLDPPSTGRALDTAPLDEPAPRSPFEASAAGGPIVVPGTIDALPPSSAGSIVIPPAAPPLTPRRRGPRVVVVAASLAVLALGTGVLAALGIVPTWTVVDRRQGRVAVLEWKNGAGSAEFAWLGEALPEFVTSELSSVAAVQVVDREAALAMAAGREGVRPQDLQSDYVVGGTFYESGGKVKVVATVLGPDGAVFWSKPALFAKEDVLTELTALSQAVAVALAEGWIETQREEPIIALGTRGVKSAPAEVAQARDEAAPRAKLAGRREAPGAPSPPTAAPDAPPPPAAPPPSPAEGAAAEPPTAGAPASSELFAGGELEQALEADVPAKAKEELAERKDDEAGGGGGGQVTGSPSKPARSRGGAAPSVEPAPPPAPAQAPADAPAAPVEPAQAAAPAPTLLEQLRDPAARQLDGWKLGTLLTAACCSDDPAVVQEALAVARSQPRAGALVRALDARLRALR